MAEGVTTICTVWKCRSFVLGAVAQPRWNSQQAMLLKIPVVSTLLLAAVLAITPGKLSLIHFQSDLKQAVGMEAVGIFHSSLHAQCHSHRNGFDM